MDQTVAAQDGPLLLVVDDDDNARAALVNTVMARGFRVLECATGLEAVASLQAGELPDLILLDLIMPVMDGWEFRRWLQRREECAHIPVIVLSADASPEARELQADAFLSKPLSATPLLQTVDAVLARSQATAVEQQLGQLGQQLGDVVRPMRFSTLTVEADLEAAIQHVDAPEPNVALAKACLLRALAGTRNLHVRLAQAELFADRNYGLPQSLAPRVLPVDDERGRLLLAEALDAAFAVNVAGSALKASRTQPSSWKVSGRDRAESRAYRARSAVSARRLKLWRDSALHFVHTLLYALLQFRGRALGRAEQPVAARTDQAVFPARRRKQQPGASA